jgi:hypothetical protein
VRGIKGEDAVIPTKARRRHCDRERSVAGSNPENHLARRCEGAKKIVFTAKTAKTEKMLGVLCALCVLCG